MSDQVISGNFTFTETAIEGVKIVDVKAYGDDRGYFMETYKRPDFIAGGIDCEFVQDNQSSAARVAFSDRAPAGEARACCFRQGFRCGG